VAGQKAVTKHKSKASEAGLPEKNALMYNGIKDVTQTMVL